MQVSHEDQTRQRIRAARASLRLHGPWGTGMCRCGRPLSGVVEATLPVCSVAAQWWRDLQLWSGRLALLKSTTTRTELLPMVVTR